VSVDEGATIPDQVAGETVTRPEAPSLKTRAWLEPFERHLHQQGYRRSAIRRHLKWLALVGDYLDARAIDPLRLAEPATVQQYLDYWENLGERPRPAEIQRIQIAVRQWLRYARHTGQLAEPKDDAPPLIREYLQFQRDHRGLSVSGLKAQQRQLVSLGDYISRRGLRSLVDIPLGVLDEFVADGRRSRSDVISVGAAVRGFLRYLFLMGKEPVDRSRWITLPRKYRNERLPLHLSDLQLEQALRSVNRQTYFGKKRWAILTLLSNYGLRIGEVARLRLEDVDFKGKSLRVWRNKTGRESIFPLTPAVEEALLDYLAVRPPAAFPELFLTSVAPYRPYARGSSMGGHCVSPVLAKVAGVPGKGAHVFRHTLARRMRQEGLPLPLMRQVLGHESSNSTGHYQRIALDELREVSDNYANLL
jgi:integrase/recombinase XerD